MSLALINESAKEVRRLAIAGSPLAVGDFRLKKLIAPLEQAGTKVPVFGQVAKAIGDLVNGKEADSASNLLSLSTLLNAILYTQGQTGAEGDIGELETFGTSCTSTKTTARVLKPLVEALSSSGGERYKIVKAAVERGAFSDLRLIEPAIRALDDNYPEMADLVAEKILPTYGPGIAPLLKQKLNIKGKKSDARRLRILHQLDPGGTIDLCKTALEDGSPDVKVAAIGCLGKHEEHVALVSEQANSKNKAVRAAALEALAEHDRPEIVKMFSDLIQGKALELLIKPFGVIRNQQVVNSLLAEGKRVFDLIVKGDAEQIPRFWEILSCLEERKDSVGEEFVLTCFAQSEKLSKLKAPKNSPLGGADLIDRLASLLYKTGAPKALEAVLAKRDVLPLVTFPVALRSARRLWPPDKVYTEFSPLLDQKKGQGKDKAEQIERLVLESHWDQSSRFELMMADEPDSPDAEALRKAEWDARWLAAGLKADRLLMVCCLARSDHKPSIEYLNKRLDGKNLYTGLIIQALARCQYAKLTDAFLNVVKKKTKSARYLDYEVQLLFESARYLPAADLPRLEEIAADMDEKFVDKYLEGLAPLRASTR